MPGITDAPDDAFEITFADLAHAQLRDKAPALLDYLLGFQVIDKNDDQTHGIGVMGFKVGEQMIFVPSFFLNGELKQNLIYIKNQDLFVPLQDNWVSYLLNRRPMVMGEAEHDKEQQLGVMQPDLTTLSNTLRGDTAADAFGTRRASWEPWAQESVGMFDKLTDRYKDLQTLPEFLNKNANYNMSGVLAKAIREDHKLGNAVFRFYDAGSLMFKPASCSKGITALSKRKNRRMQRGMKYPPEVKRSSILHDVDSLFDRSGPHRVRVMRGIGQHVLLPNEDLEKLARGELVIKDAREEANIAYKTEGAARLQNPDDAGTYELLLSDGKYTDVCVFPNPKAAGKGYSRVALVVDKNTGTYGYWWAYDLWVKPNEGKDRGAENPFNTSGLSDASSVAPGGAYALVSPSGCSTIAFRVKKKIKTTNGLTELFVQPLVQTPSDTAYYNKVTDEDTTQFGKGYSTPFVGDVEHNKRRGNEEYDVPNYKMPFSSLNHIVITNDDRDIRAVGNTLFVPDTAKAIKLKSGTKLNTWAKNDPSSLIDVEMNLLKSGAEKIELLKKGSAICVDGQGPFDRDEVIVSLIKKAGLRGASALSMVSGLREDVRTRFLVKNAVGFAPPIPEPEMGFDDYANVQEQYPMEDYLAVDTPMPPTDAYVGKPEKQQIMDAASTGQKDIFDTSAIASLVRTSNSDDLIVKYLSDLILGLDRVCRITFMFYWMNEKFRDRYGQENLVELEDQLKSVSKSLGDLVLFLKQRQVEGSPDFSAMEIEMGMGAR